MTNKAYPTAILTVLSIAFASFIARLNLYTVNVALPTISRAFHIGTEETSRIIMVYLLVITSSLMLFGKLGDRMGLKRMFISGYVVFIVGSLLCGLSWGINPLLASRFVQGLGASMLLAASFATIARVVPHERLGWAFGINATATAVGVAAGAPLGGIIAGYLSWKWIFFINVPLGIAAIFCAMKWIPSIQCDKGLSFSDFFKRFDLFGAILSFIGLAALLIGLGSGQEFGWASTRVITALSVAMVFLASFFVWEKRHKDPLLDMAILKNMTFGFALCALTMAYMLIAGNSFLLPFYLEIGKGLSPVAIGLVLLIYSIIYVTVSPYAGGLSDRVNPGLLSVVAMLSATINVFLFSHILRWEGIGSVYLFLAWLGFSYVFFLSPNNTLVMRLAPAGKEGVVSGLLNTAINFSMVLGVAIFEMVFSGSLGDLAGPGKSLHAINKTAPALMNGFSLAYVSGGFMCLFATIFSLLVWRQSVDKKVL